MTTVSDLKRFAVLYVDDEEQALKYFPKLFGGDLRCLTAASVAEARKVIEREGDGIGVVISDQRMPGESGVELLSWLRATRPQVVRLLTTAYSDLDSAIAAVNSGAIFRYVIKPWEHRELYGVLARAMEFHIVTRERDSLLQEKLTSLQRIVMMDRRRCFAVLAAGLSARVRNPLGALRQYLLSAPAAVPAAGQGADADLWQAAERESRHLFALSEALGREVLDPRPRYASGLAVAELIAPAFGDAQRALGQGAALAISAGTPALSADREMAIRLLRLLVALALRVQGPGGSPRPARGAGSRRRRGAHRHHRRPRRLDPGPGRRALRRGDRERRRRRRRRGRPARRPAARLPPCRHPRGPSGRPRRPGLRAGAAARSRRDPRPGAGQAVDRRPAVLPAGRVNPRGGPAMHQPWQLPTIACWRARPPAQSRSYLP